VALATGNATLLLTALRYCDDTIGALIIRQHVNRVLRQVAVTSSL